MASTLSGTGRREPNCPTSVLERSLFRKKFPGPPAARASACRPPGTASRPRRPRREGPPLPTERARTSPLPQEISGASRRTRQRLPTFRQGIQPSLHQRQIVLSFTPSSPATSSVPSRSIVCSLPGLVVNLGPFPAPAWRPRGVRISAYRALRHTFRCDRYTFMCTFTAFYLLLVDFTLSTHTVLGVTAGHRRAEA